MRRVMRRGGARVGGGGPRKYTLGYGLLFAANADKVVVADHASLSPTTAMSFACWVNQTTGQVAEREIASKFSAGSSNGWFFRSNVDKLSLGIKIGAAATGRNDTPNASFAQGVLTHIGWTFDGGTVAIYIHGIAQTLTLTNVVPNAMEDNTADLEFGEATGIAGTVWNGIIDEPAVWNVGLTAAEMFADSRRRRPQRGLQAWWRFNEASGTTAVDHVGGNTGTITGATYVAL